MTTNIQIGHIARHTPKGAGAQGREATIGKMFVTRAS
jgi:hypothetical protein